MPYNPETEEFYQAPATIVDSTPDGDTVQEGFDDRLTPAMTGVYTDLNLLKENGMIGVGIPATTTARGIGRVATLADMEPGAEVGNGPAFLAAGSEAVTITPTPNAVPQADADGDVWGLAKNDMSNLTETGTTTIAHNAMPSTRYVNVAIPPNNGTLTAPADGYYRFSAAASAANGNIVLVSSLITSAWIPLQSGQGHIYLPVKNGTVVTVQLSNVTSMSIKFVYAEGAY